MTQGPTTETRLKGREGAREGGCRGLLNPEAMKVRVAHLAGHLEVYLARRPQTSVVTVASVEAGLVPSSIETS